MKTLKIRQVTIGEGRPKVCVPLMGSSLEAVTAEAAAAASLGADLVEWRIDAFEHADDTQLAMEALGRIRAAAGELPLIFTFRTAREGGLRDIAPERYTALNRAAAASGHADLIDVELFSGEDIVRDLIHAAQAAGVHTIVSSHDFDRTPPLEELISRLRRAQELGGDLPKLAVMPQSAGDVLTLLEATRVMTERYADRPIITMSMAGLGLVSRLAGEVFGSAVTFGSAGRASAPGQIPAAELRALLERQHSGLKG